ncbi:MAG: hypothetical protein RR270_07450 [Alistipes sp.]
MKNTVRFAALLVLLVTLTGCRAQKFAATSDHQTPQSEAYQQALHLIEIQRFVLQVDQVLFPKKDQPVKDSPDSYLSMQGSLGIIHFAPDLFPFSQFSNLHIEDKAATLTPSKVRKSGDRQFALKIWGPHNWLQYNVVMTLYNNTNECLAQINYKSGQTMVSLKGRIVPRTE